MPRITSFFVFRPNVLSKRSPSRPYQLACIPSTVVGWAMIAGVQSTVWIFAISAATDKPRLLVELLVGQLRVLRVQAVADRVVLPHEERVQQREADPEVSRHTFEVDAARRARAVAGRRRRS